MKTFWILTTAWMLSGCELRANNSCEHSESSFRCVEFERNYDGDTVTFNIPNVHPLFGKDISVRLLGIDTAEIKGKNDCEKTAARTTQRLVESLLKNAKQIDLENVQRDKYFRILADVKVDGKSVSQLLIKNGLAVAYDGGTKKKINWCAVAETRLPKLN